MYLCVSVCVSVCVLSWIYACMCIYTYNAILNKHNLGGKYRNERNKHS